MRQSAIAQQRLDNHPAIDATSKPTRNVRVKTLLFTTLLTYIVLMLPTPGYAAQSATDQNLTVEVLKLKTNVEVHKDVVTLGDIFENITRYKSEPVFKSPPLGRAGTVRIERLIEAAETYNFTFETPTKLRKITISRPARTIKAETIKKLLIEKLSKHNPLRNGGKYQLAFKNMPDGIILPLSYSGKLKLKKFSYDKLQNSFRAHFLPIEARGREYQKIITGSAVEVVKRPVIKREIRRGDKISASDIEIRTFRPNRIPKNSLRNSTEIIGMTAAQNLRIGSFIKSADINTPVLIKKNQLVTLILERPGMSLKTQGKAMEDAGLNETISVMNIHSKRIVHGIALASGVVKIQHFENKIKLQKTAQLEQSR